MSWVKNIIHNWRKKHKLSYTNDETFFVKWSFKVSAFNILTLVLLYSIILGFILFLLILYTPLKRVIFDQSTYDLNELYIQNTKSLVKLENTMRANEHYVSDIRKILNGDDFIDTAHKEMDTLEGIIDIEFNSSEADSLLREKVEQDVFSISNPKESNEITGFFMSPVNGTISRSLDKSQQHYGVDIVTKSDEPIKATLEGYVIFSEWTNRQGNVVIIQHANDMLSAYKHCSILLKKAGTYVEAGDPIAIVGNTGELTDGPHLHFEIWKGGVVLNPQEFINF